LREQLAILIKLQKTESAAAGIIAKKKDLPVRINRLEEEFKACCEAVEKEREQLEALRKSRREKDIHLQKGQETLKRSRERLFEVKTNKEYQSILKEIETLEEKKKMEEELNSLAGELDVCVRKSADLKKGISPEILRKYEQIKNAGRVVAVVSVWKEVCDGCHMSIPPQLYNNLQKSTTLITCPNCNRIIYWERRDG